MIGRFVICTFHQANPGDTVKNEMAGECDDVLLEKSEGKRPLTRPRRRWGDNFKTDVQETGWE